MSKCITNKSTLIQRGKVTHCPCLFYYDFHPPVTHFLGEEVLTSAFLGNAKLFDFSIFHGQVQNPLKLIGRYSYCLEYFPLFVNIK